MLKTLLWLLICCTCWAASARAADVPIIIYHHIQHLPADASASMRRWTMPPEKFEAQIEWLAKEGFQPITMAQLMAHMKNGAPLPAKPIVITFDDGWKEHYSYAFHVLKKYNFLATFFIVSGSVGHSAYMDWQEIKELAAAGMDIQSHSVTHARLTTLKPDDLWRELAESKKTLEDQLGKPVTVLAYPYGSYNQKVVAMVKKAGYEGAAAVRGLNGGFVFRADPSYTLTRYALEGRDNLAHIARLKGFHSGKDELRPAAHRALFVSVIQKPSVLSSRKEITDLVNFAKKARIKTLFIQVYQSGRAWFPSQIADAAPYAQAVKSVGQDPLVLLIKEAQKRGIQVHAWLNLMSLGSNSNASFVQKYGPDVLTRNLDPKKSIEDYKIDGQYFLEPGDPRVRGELGAIVEEVLSAYPKLDGIQFDYIRYPDVKPHYGYTKVNVERFKKATGLQEIDEKSEAWGDWKRAQVTELLADLAQRARTRRPGIQVSTTGCMPYVRAYQEAFQDWPSWMSKGLADFVTVMNYSSDSEQFERWIVAAKEKTADFSKVGIGVGAYKLEKEPQTFAQQFSRCEEMGVMCAVFHYGSLREAPALEELLTASRS